jgi:hypothetical protein
MRLLKVRVHLTMGIAELLLSGRLRRVDELLGDLAYAFALLAALLIPTGIPNICNCLQIGNCEIAAARSNSE